MCSLIPSETFGQVRWGGGGGRSLMQSFEVRFFIVYLLSPLTRLQGIFALFQRRQEEPLMSHCGPGKQLSASAIYLPPLYPRPTSHTHTHTRR